jgi:uncharacterized protein (TIGR02596 family)
MGFTLVELLVVLAVIAIVATLAVPGINSALKGSQLDQAGQMVHDQLNFYRQYAVANNVTVEARFYNFVDPFIPNDTGHYRAMQAFSIRLTASATGALSFTKTPISKPVRLPPSIIFDSGYGTSAGNSICYMIRTLASTSSNVTNLGEANVGSQTPTSDTPPDPPILNVGTNYTYAAFQFRPDGSTNLAQTNYWSWCLTLHALSAGDALTSTKISSGALKNYYTIQVDPANGHFNTYRP